MYQNTLVKLFSSVAAAFIVSSCVQNNGVNMPHAENMLSTAPGANISSTSAYIEGTNAQQHTYVTTNPETGELIREASYVQNENKDIMSFTISFQDEQGERHIMGAGPVDKPWHEVVFWLQNFIYEKIPLNEVENGFKIITNQPMPAPPEDSQSNMALAHLDKT